MVSPGQNIDAETQLIIYMNPRALLQISHGGMTVAKLANFASEAWRNDSVVSVCDDSIFCRLTVSKTPENKKLRKYSLGHVWEAFFGHVHKLKHVYVSRCFIF